MLVPIIDLFAGPGGLGEGFSKVNFVDFRIAISVEKDAMAHQTLRLRAAHRALSRMPQTTAETWGCWDSIVGTYAWDKVFEALKASQNQHIRRACREASSEAVCVELGPSNRAEISAMIRERVSSFSKGGRIPKNLVLIGGPPCQAYSIVGRARNKGTQGYKPEDDHRHFLYKEYLHVIAEFRPAVFVMENVKGILSSKVDEGRIFHTIMSDLQRPDVAADTEQPVEYVLQSLVGTSMAELSPDDFVLRSENFGVPQARHRVIILGIRRDVFEAVGTFKRMQTSEAPTVSEVIDDLPSLRPQLSHRGKGENHKTALKAMLFDQAIRELRRSNGVSAIAVAERMKLVRENALGQGTDPGYGGSMVYLDKKREFNPKKLVGWYKDRETKLLANHESRAHMPSDLVRYLFAAAFGEIVGRSPKLIDFPRSLLPDHGNVDADNISASIFKDRFRVQIGGRFAMTITSHIAKDGHAFIHPHASQYRSLTVREAARIQTFPDTYVFLGNRTSQFTQVGNAVPPYLAKQVAEVVAGILCEAKLV